MIPMPPPPPAGQFSVSRVWHCTSCGYLAKIDISSAACPNCGSIGLEESSNRKDPSSGSLQSGAQGLSSEIALPEIGHQDADTVPAGSPDPSALFILAAEASSSIVTRINSCLGTDIFVEFGEFPDDLFGTTATGYLVTARRPISVQDMADLTDSLNLPQMDNSVDDKLLNPALHSSDPAGMLANAPAAHNFKSEQHEDWEIVDRSSNENKDLRAPSNEMSTQDIKSNDTKVLEPLDTRYSLITKPQRFFKVGRVFMTLWSEPASSTARDGPNLSSSNIGGRIFSETRRFVVVRSGRGYALCCPIQTYQKRGTTKSHVDLENHATVYVVGSEPKLLPEEESPAMGNFPIVIEDKSVTIDPSSRLNLGKVYTVEHNIKVRNIGKISKETVPKLKAALVRSMGVNVSDAEVETGTESEDNVSRPTPIKSQPSSHSGSKNSSSSSMGKGSSSSGRTSSSSSASTARGSVFFVSNAGIDREVITTDICRYLGNDALVRPGAYKDPKTGRSQDGYYITAYRAPTSAQLADLKADSLRWQEERRKNSAQVQGGYNEWATRQAAMSSSPFEAPQVRGGYPPSSYGQALPSLLHNYNYVAQSGYPTQSLPTPPTSMSYFPSLSIQAPSHPSGYPSYSPSAYPTPGYGTQVPEIRSSDYYNADDSE